MLILIVLMIVLMAFMFYFYYSDSGKCLSDPLKYGLGKLKIEYRCTCSAEINKGQVSRFYFDKDNFAFMP